MRALGEKTGFLFDLDGTLLDSNAAHARAFQRALAADHPEIARAFDYDAVRGLDTPTTLRRLGLTDPAAISRLTAQKRALYRELLRAGEVVLQPGAAALLAALHAAGRRLIVVTSASRPTAAEVLERAEITHFFDDLITADDVPAPKPAPDPFLLARARLGLAPSACLTVEDAPACALASQRAGIDAVLVHAAHPLDEVPCFATLADLHASLGLGPGR